MDAGQVRQCALLVKWRWFWWESIPKPVCKSSVFIVMVRLQGLWPTVVRWWCCNQESRHELPLFVSTALEQMTCQVGDQWTVLTWYALTRKKNDTWSSFWGISSVCRSLAVKVLLADNDVGLVLAFRQGFSICLVFVEQTEPEDMLKWCVAGQAQWPKRFRVRRAC